MKWLKGCVFGSMASFVAVVFLLGSRGYVDRWAELGVHVWIFRALAAWGIVALVAGCICMHRAISG